MTDRQPTNILANGARRYAVYNEGGEFQRYEWIVLDDEPTADGTPLAKPTLLDDTTATDIFGTITGDETVNDALLALSQGALQMATGTYQGTGSTEIDIPTGVEPALLFVWPVGSREYEYIQVVNGKGMRMGLSSNSYAMPTYLTSVSYADGVVTIDTGNSNYPLNVLDDEYTYVAIGRKP